METEMHAVRPCWITAFACALILLGDSGDVRAASHNSLMDISTDGRLLACSNRDAGTVSVIDLAMKRKIREIPVGREPEGVTFLGAGHQLAVAAYADDKVVFLNADTGRVDAEVPVTDEPYGLASDAAGKTLFVTLEYPGEVAAIDVGSHNVSRKFFAGKFVRGIALAEAERRIYVTEYFTGIVRAFDAATGNGLGVWAGVSSDNLARQIVLHPRRPKAYVPHIRSRVAAAHGEGSIFPVVSVIDLNAAGQRKRIPLDSFRGAFVVSNPWEAAISPDGRRMYLVLAGTDDLFVGDLLDDDYQELEYHDYAEVGRNPRAVKVSPDNKTVYVYNALDFAVAAYDADSMERIAAIPVCGNPLGEEVLLGKILFYSARQPMVGRRWISCASCHPDGDADGRTWHNPEGLRNTQPLFGLAWTHPLHWSADRDEVQDFEHTIRGQLMQGRGLVAGSLNPALGSQNKGLSHKLDALAAYTNTHRFTLSPHSKNGLSDAAKRGRILFFSEQSRCATCHSGPLFTDSTPRSKPLLHDVGTGRDDASEKNGTAYDTPTLLGVYRSAPYLHDGSAATLRDLLTKQNQADQHGKTSQLTPQQVDDLVEFLKALPYEDPEPAARKAGLTKVEQ
jgi:YVTN family beta-propeller protein